MCVCFLLLLYIYFGGIFLHQNPTMEEDAVEKKTGKLSESLLKQSHGETKDNSP